MDFMAITWDHDNNNMTTADHVGSVGWRDKKDDYKSWRWASGGILFKREIPGTDQGAAAMEIYYS